MRGHSASLDLRSAPLTRVPCSPGAIIAGAYASLLHLGVDGYTSLCSEIVGAAKKLVRGLRADFPELYVLGDPLVSVVAFGSRTEGQGNGLGMVPIYEVGDKMDKMGWHRAFPSSSSFRAGIRVHQRSEGSTRVC